jgi:hypothetical protein
MTNNIFSEVKDKHFDVKHDFLGYIFCDQCTWNGFPNEKIVRVFHGLRPEYEDGFIYRYTEYDYDPVGKNRIIHVHKYDQQIIDEQVRSILERLNKEVDHVT